MKPVPQSQSRKVNVQFGQIESLVTYEVSEMELEQVSQGQGSSLFLNLGGIFLSSAISLIAALCAGTFSTQWVFQVFVIVAVVSGIAAIVLLALWWKTRKQVSEVVSRIRSRIPTRP